MDYAQICLTLAWLLIALTYLVGHALSTPPSRGFKALGEELMRGSLGGAFFVMTLSAYWPLKLFGIEWSVEAWRAASEAVVGLSCQAEGYAAAVRNTLLFSSLAATAGSAIVAILMPVAIPAIRLLWRFMGYAFSAGSALAVLAGVVSNLLLALAWCMTALALTLPAMSAVSPPLLAVPHTRRLDVTLAVTCLVLTAALPFAIAAVCDLNIDLSTPAEALQEARIKFQPTLAERGVVKVKVADASGSPSPVAAVIVKDELDSKPWLAFTNLNGEAWLLLPKSQQGAYSCSSGYELTLAHSGYVLSRRSFKVFEAHDPLELAREVEGGALTPDVELSFNVDGLYVLQGGLALAKGCVKEGLNTVHASTRLRSGERLAITLATMHGVDVRAYASHPTPPRTTRSWT